MDRNSSDPITLTGACHCGAVRFTATGGQRVTARTAAEVLVWEMHAQAGR